MTKVGVKQQMVIAPRCLTCQFGMSHEGFNYDMLHSVYFDPESHLSVKAVMEKHGLKQPMINVMRHLKRHVEPKRLGTIAKQVKHALAIAEADDIRPGYRWRFHEDALDKTIEEYYKALDSGKIKVTADIGLKAIQIKANIEKARQDRGMGALRGFMGMSNEQLPETTGIPEPAGTITGPRVPVSEPSRESAD